MSKVDTSTEYFADSFNCSQSVLVAFAPDYGLPINQALKLATAFGAGMGRQQHVCGAVTGALMALGLHYGKGQTDNNDKKTLTYQKTVAFMNEFKKRNGSINCKELLRGLDMGNPEEYQKIQDLNLFDNECVKYVQDATEIVEKLIK
jgi:C_GCAxxG_C_C family probable redox protein